MKEVGAQEVAAISKKVDVMEGVDLKVQNSAVQTLEDPIQNCEQVTLKEEVADWSQNVTSKEVEVMEGVVQNSAIQTLKEEDPIQNCEKVTLKEEVVRVADRSQNVTLKEVEVMVEVMGKAADINRKHEKVLALTMKCQKLKKVSLKNVEAGEGMTEVGLILQIVFVVEVGEERLAHLAVALYFVLQALKFEVVDAEVADPHL